MFTSESKSARRLQNVLIALACAFGLAVPIFVMLHNGADAASRGPDGITLTANETAGRTLFAKACATCHTLSATKSVGRVGPNLDVLKPSQALVVYAIANGIAIGQGQMPALLCTGQDAQDVAQFVYAVAGK